MHTDRDTILYGTPFETFVTKGNSIFLAGDWFRNRRAIQIIPMRSFLEVSEKVLSPASSKADLSIPSFCKR